MKLLHVLAAFLPLISISAAVVAAAAPPTACKCAPTQCPTTQPEQCQCENENAKRCAQLCGTIYKPKKWGTICGSRGLPPCKEGLTCIDNPTKPGCQIAADCPGLCVKLDGPFCGGFAGISCPNQDEYCVDDPRDTCGPPTGADCGGICVYLNGKSAQVKNES